MKATLYWNLDDNSSTLAVGNEEWKEVSKGDNDGWFARGELTTETEASLMAELQDYLDMKGIEVDEVEVTIAI